MIQRQHPRFGIEFPVSFAGDHTGDGIVTNLSLGGCRVEEADVEVAAKATLKLRLYLRFRDAPLAIDAACVRWSAGGGFGLQFVSISDEEQKRLQRYIDELPA